MKIFFTGTVAAWIIIPFLIALASFTVLVYRRHSLARPWNIWLPTLRITVLTLLLLALFQPVATRIRSTVIHGRIPVIVDTSGSMSLVDNYPVDRRVAIAWQMGMFKRKLRNTDFIDIAAEAHSLRGTIDEADRRRAALASQLQAKTPWDRTFSADVRRFSENLRDIARSLDRIRKTVLSSVAGTDYLVPAGTNGINGLAVKGPADAPGPGIDEFDRSCAGFNTLVTNSTTELNGLAEAIDRINGARLKDPPALDRAFDEFRARIQAFALLTGALDGLQRNSDIRLAGAGIEEVDKALAELAHMTRMDLATYILTRPPYELFSRLQKRGDVAVFSLEEDSDSIVPSELRAISAGLPSTRLGSAIDAVLKRYEKDPVAGIVLISDGRNNAGKSILTIAESLRERGIAVFSLGIGSTVPPPDIAIERVLAPRTSFLQDRLSVGVVLRRHGYGDRPIKLTVTCEDVTVGETVVEPGEEDQVQVDMSFLEETGGPHAYTVVAQHFDGEAVEHNNRRTFAVNILEDRIRTLLVDEFPRWESRYVNMMLTRDKRVDLTTVFVASTPDNALPLRPTEPDAVGDAAAGDFFPASRQELFGYHIVMLGDVNPAHFTKQQLNDIRAFVIERGGTLITMAGPHYMPARYAGTPIADLVPLRKLAGRPARSRLYDGPTDPKGSPAASGRFRLHVEEFAEYDDITQIGATPEMSKELWEDLPRLDWIRQGGAAAPSADLLVTGIDASHAGTERSTAINSSPVVVKMYAGLGKVMYLGSDEFWRWRYFARWTYHHRLWGQILLWSTMGRTTGIDSRIKLMVDRPAYAPEETVRIKARLLDSSGAPVDDADPMLEVHRVAGNVAPNQPVKIVPMIHLEGSGGEYRAQIRDLPRGRYRVVPRVSEIRGQEQAEAIFDVRDLSTTEYIDLAMDEPLLQRLSRKYRRFENALDLVQDIPEVEFVEEHRTDTELWDTYPFLALVLALLSFEWVLRKRHKLA